jgi:hypothetical protein
MSRLTSMYGTDFNIFGKPIPVNFYPISFKRKIKADFFITMLCVCESPFINPIFIKLGMYIMTSELISTVYFINPFHQSACLSLLSLLRNGCVNNVPAVMNTRNNIIIVGRVDFCEVRAISKENKRLILPRTFCFLFRIRFCL